MKPVLDRLDRHGSEQTCPHCGVKFTAKSQRQRFCSVNCYVKSYNKKQEKKKKEDTFIDWVAVCSPACKLDDR